MSHPVNDEILDRMNELYSLIDHLSAQLIECSLYGKYDEADQLYGEIQDLEQEVLKLENQF